MIYLIALLGFSIGLVVGGVIVYWEEKQRHRLELAMKDAAIKALCGHIAAIYYQPHITEKNPFETFGEEPK